MQHIFVFEVNYLFNFHITFCRRQLLSCQNLTFLSSLNDKSLFYDLMGIFILVYQTSFVMVLAFIWAISETNWLIKSQVICSCFYKMDKRQDFCQGLYS